MASDMTPAAPARRWPKALLAISLAFNLLILGLIVGAQFRDERDTNRFPPPDRSVMRDSGFAPFFDSLPRDARNRMGAALRENQRAFAPDRVVLAAEFRTMLEVLRAEPFEPAALQAVLAAQQDRVAARVEAGRAILLDQIARMSPAERRSFADALEKHFAHARPDQGPRDGAGGAAPPTAN